MMWKTPLFFVRTRIGRGGGGIIENKKKFKIS